MADKEVKYTQKKIDESWKEEVAKEKGKTPPSESQKPALSFSVFVTSLGYQALMQLGELPHPETKQPEIDLEAAKETIDLLILLESKTKGNRTPEEEELLRQLLPELQMKFVQKTSPS